MFKNLPLNALRSFEAAARHGNLKNAAEELSVTVSAVSLQIKNLEEWIGTPLFIRSANGMRLTDSGDRLFNAIHKSLYDLSSALQEHQQVIGTQVLKVTTTPEFAALWLIPRLEDFYLKHPDVRLRIMPTNDLVDLLRTHEFHLAIRSTSRDYPDHYQEDLLDESFGVFVSPKLLERAQDDPPRLIDLAWSPGVAAPTSWAQWCAHANLRHWLGKELLDYHDEHLALQAAIAGQGYALASCILADCSVKDGSLLPYCPEVVLPGKRYVALCKPGKERHADIRIFLDWLHQQAAAC